MSFPLDMVTFIAGRKRRGKSSLANWLAHQQAKRLYWDPKAYWRPVPGDVEARDRIVHGRFANVDPTTETLAEQWRYAPEIVFQPSDVKAEWPTFIRLVREHVQAHPRDRIAVVIDEYGMVDPSWEMEDFDWLLRAAEGEYVEIYLVGHRIIDLKPRWRTLVEYYAIFNVVLPNDAKELAQMMPVEPEMLMALKDRAFYWWDDGVGEGRVIDNPQSWFQPFIPARKTPAVDAPRHAAIE